MTELPAFLLSQFLELWPIRSKEIEHSLHNWLVHLKLLRQITSEKLTQTPVTLQSHFINININIF